MAKEPDIKNVFIDLDDTLYDFSASSRESFNEAYDLLGYGRFFDSFEHFMSIYTPRNLQLWELYGRGEITKEELNALRYSYPLEVVGIHDKELAARFCSEALGRIPSKNKLVPGAVELLEYLAPKYNLYILSNGFQELQDHKMRTTGIRHYFKELILSDHIGVNKPRPELFEYALRKTCATVENSIMIGDMFETDIVGARNIGLKQIFYNAKGVRDMAFIPTYEVTALENIMEIL